MKNDGFYPLCGGCSRKEKRDDLGIGIYHCIVADDFIPRGIVRDDTDATNCYQENLYIPKT